jgi:hypothetical protein
LHGEMIRVEREGRFPVPVEVGFSFITDMANWPRYWPGFLRLESGSQWRAPGDEARVVVRLLGRDFSSNTSRGLGFGASMTSSFSGAASIETIVNLQAVLSS